MKLLLYFTGFLLWYLSCKQDSRSFAKLPVQTNTEVQFTDTIINSDTATASATIIAQHAIPDSIVAFAKTLIGVTYKYASADPSQGFDCSGFITYVFNHFSIDVPRSSVDFTNLGKEIYKAEAKPGDLILFTGTDSAVYVVGHMGIVTNNSDSLRFIHATSGKKYGVTITTLNGYYQQRFVKVIRII